MQFDECLHSAEVGWSKTSASTSESQAVHLKAAKKQPLWEIGLSQSPSSMAFVKEAI